MHEEMNEHALTGREAQGDSIQ